MNRNRLRVISLATAGMVLAAAIPASAEYEAYNDPDGFTLGHYTEETDSAARDGIERQYAERPKNERQAEYLTRGLTAVPGDGGTLVSWRFLGTDSDALCYNLYCNGEKINDEPIDNSSFFHVGAPSGAEYTLKEVENGVENGTEVKTTAWDKNYIEFAVKERDGYNIDDGGVADLDGDGEYEILLRRVPSMDVSTRTTYPLIEAYKTDGTLMWTIDIGPNEINEIDINFMAYDMDGDGKAEVIMRSFEGTTDGAGNQIGDTNNDGITDYSKDADNLAIFKDRQYIISTPEFLSIYDGETGAEEDRTDLLPSREPLSEWSYDYTDTGRLTKRASHFLFGLAYLDGVTPSVVMVRGAWDQVRAAAWHIEDGKFKEDWVSNTPCVEDINSIYGACNHNLVTADVDFDGKDEIVSGPMAIDDDGSALYTVKTTDNDGNVVKLGHGDAFDTAKMDPDYSGYLTWACHEKSPLLANIELHDAATGKIMWGYGKNKDTGRSRAADIDPTKRGFEVWGSTGSIPANISGETLADTWNDFTLRKLDGTTDKISLPMNFKIQWDGDLLSELLDDTTIYKYNWETGEVDTLMTAEDCGSQCGTKATPCAAADLFGDWRDEVVWRTADDKAVRIYSTSIPTEYKLNTPMHDSYYRASVAVQNNHYNQPANISYYLGSETKEVPIFEGYTVKDGQKLTNPDLTGNHGTYTVGDGTTAPMSVKLCVGTPNAYIGNDIKKIDPDDENVVPIIEDDRTLVPVRFIAESLGLDVAYDDDTREVEITGGGYDVKMTLDKTEYTVNDAPLTLDVPARSIHDRTMIPLRAMAEAIGMEVEWDGDNGLIYIGRTPFYGKNDAKLFADSMKSGVAVTPSPVSAATEEPTEEPDLLATAQYTEYTDSNNVTWKLYVDEDYEDKSAGDAAGWAGTKKPGILANIGVADNGGNKVMHFEDSTKGSRNAVYTLPYKLTGTVLIEFDWTNGDCTGGDSYGEIRLADSANNVFFALKTKQGELMQTGYGGGIKNGNADDNWETISSSFGVNATYHVSLQADFDKKVCTGTVSKGTVSEQITPVIFENGNDFSAIEVLAVRVTKNFTWQTEIDNLKIGVKK